MSQRVFLDRALVVTLPLNLNPTNILSLSGNNIGSQRAKTRTDIIVHYVPEVGADTPGQVMLGFSTYPRTEPKDIMACSPLRVAAAWRPCALRIPKTLINQASWVDAAHEGPYLCAAGLKGRVTITCTLECLNTSSLVPPPAPTLSDIDTRCYIGPRLVGFSLVACMPESIQPAWNGRGLCLNVSLLNGLERVRSARYIATPKTGNLVAVRYGFGNTFTYTYNSGNKGLRWRDAFGATIHDVTNSPGDTSGTAVQYNYGGSWAVIKGNTDWWAEINPKHTTAVLGGMTFTWYYPCCQLIMYYDYGSVNIMDDSFWPGLTVDPEQEQPAPPPGWADPAKDVELPLNAMRTTVIMPPQWDIADEQKHASRAQVLDHFKLLKEGFLDWPVAYWLSLIHI